MSMHLIHFSLELCEIKYYINRQAHVLHAYLSRAEIVAFFRVIVEGSNICLCFVLI